MAVDLMKARILADSIPLSSGMVMLAMADELEDLRAYKHRREQEDEARRQHGYEPLA